MDRSDRLLEARPGAGGATLTRSACRVGPAALRRADPPAGRDPWSAGGSAPKRLDPPYTEVGTPGCHRPPRRGGKTPDALPPGPLFRISPMTRPLLCLALLVPSAAAADPPAGSANRLA